MSEQEQPQTEKPPAVEVGIDFDKLTVTLTVRHPPTGLVLNMALSPDAATNIGVDMLHTSGIVRMEQAATLREAKEAGVIREGKEEEEG